MAVKQVAGPRPRFLMPCSSFDRTNPSPPWPGREVARGMVNSTVASRISHISEWTRGGDGCGNARRGSVVSCLSIGSTVVILTVRIRLMSACSDAFVPAWFPRQAKLRASPSANAGNAARAVTRAGIKLHTARLLKHISTSSEDIARVLRLPGCPVKWARYV